MKAINLIHKPLPQNPDIWVSVPDYKEPILPVRGGYGWYGLQAYDFQGDKLMCHECGKFTESLATHIKIHKLDKTQYKDKYGLLHKSKLTSTTLSHKFSEHFKGIEKVKHNQTVERLAQLRARAKELGIISNPKGNKYAVEFLNKHDTCPAQTLRGLIAASKVYGDDITFHQCNQFRPGLTDLIIKYHGSFNKGKQVAKLAINPPISKTKFPERLLLEDMVGYFRKHHKYPSLRDYRNGKMICSDMPIRCNGGLNKLIAKAKQLKDEQDKRLNDKDMSLIANRIEMEQAGRARV